MNANDKKQIEELAALVDIAVRGTLLTQKPEDAPKILSEMVTKMLTEVITEADRQIAKRDQEIEGLKSDVRAAERAYDRLKKGQTAGGDASDALRNLRAYLSSK